MTNRLTIRAVAALVLVTGSGVFSGGCSDIMHMVTGAYRGPQPVEQGISGEEVVIRRVTRLSSAPAFIVDRTRYVESGEPHNINRAAKVVATDATRDQVASLDLQVGDRVMLSTNFERITTESGSLSIPDWPGPGRPEYPLAIHSITAIARAAN